MSDCHASRVQSSPCITWKRNSCCTKTLQQQGLESAATLSCTRIPTNVYDAWRYIMCRDGDESALEGVTRINFAPAGQYLRYLPQTLQTLSFYNRHLNLSRKNMTLPHSLRDLSFWRPIQPVGQRDLAKWPSKLEFWEEFQPKLGPRDLAKWPSKLEFLG